MAQDYVRPPFGSDGVVTLQGDLAFFRGERITRLWAQWRNISPRNVTVTFLVVVPGTRNDAEDRPEIEGAELSPDVSVEVVDVSNRVARLLGTRVDTNGGARIRLANGDPLETIATAIIELGAVVHGRPDAFGVDLLEPERVT